MAKKENTEVKEKTDYVPVFLFRDNDKYKDPTLNVIINGKKYSVPRGKQVMVPREVALVIERSQEQDNLARKIDMDLQGKDQVMYM